VLIEGKIQSREYEGRDGTKRKVYEIVASDMKMIPDGRGRGNAGQEEKHGRGMKPPFEEDFVPGMEDDIPM